MARKNSNDSRNDREAHFSIISEVDGRDKVGVHKLTSPAKKSRPAKRVGKIHLLTFLVWAVAFITMISMGLQWVRI